MFLTTERVRNEKGHFMVVGGQHYKTTTKSCRVDADTHSQLESILAATGETFREWVKRNAEYDLKNVGN